MCDVQFSKVDSIFEELSRTLSQNGEVNVVSKKFSALNTNAERVFFASDLLHKYSLYPKVVQVKKSNDLSAKYRQEGNEAFKKKNDFQSWNFYTKSIIYAKSNSEYLALAYANRSAILYEKKMYKQCLEDITNAFKNNYPKHLHEKLIQREEKARELLSTQDTDNYYEKLDQKETNKQIQCATPSVEIRNSENLGRHVVAVKKIGLGDVIAIEKPYAKVLLKNCLQDHCYHCLELCYNLMPCDGCVYATYCSKKCQETAWNEYHKYECSILPTLYSLNISKLVLLALRVVLTARENYNDIINYKLDNSVYKSQRYEEIHFLEANTHHRNSADLFPRAVTASIIGNLLKTKTSFYRELNNCKNGEEIFNELLLHHLQTAPTNFHEITECAEDDKGYFNTEEIGAGAYAFLSLINHSCTPNVIRHSQGTEVILRAIKHIPIGTEILDNYGYHHAVMAKPERQRALRRQYFFDCNCMACHNDWPLYNNMSYRGKPFEIPDDSLELLRRGVKEEAVVVLAVLLGRCDKVKPSKHTNKCFADAQETIKQCLAIMGNRKPKF